MFYKEKIVSIKAADRVLEIGPGASPHPRADHFLEYKFHDKVERIRQRGEIQEEPDLLGRPISYYSGQQFPFRDGEFDYVICSHVIEHVENPELFVNEMFRVGDARGYIEFPLPTYEYMYNFDVHKHFVWFDSQSNTLYYLPKECTGLKFFSGVSDVLRSSLEDGWDDVLSRNQSAFFFGLEYERRFEVVRAGDFSSLGIAWNASLSKPSRRIQRAVSALIRRMGW